MLLVALLVALLGACAASHAPRIAIVSFHDGVDIHAKEREGLHRPNATAVRELHRVCEDNRRAYAKLYGYRYINPAKRARRWSKLLLNGKRFKLVLMLRALAHYDYVLWVDGDALFQTRQSVQEWIACMGTEHDMLVAVDTGGKYVFNSGVVLLRSTPRAERFLVDSVSELAKFPLRGGQDQFAMTNVMKRGYADMVKLYRPRYELQAFAKLREVRHESWIVHFTCCNMKCGGAPIDPAYCDARRYDFRARHPFRRTAEQIPFRPEAGTDGAARQGRESRRKWRWL